LKVKILQEIGRQFVGLRGQGRGIEPPLLLSRDGQRNVGQHRLEAPDMIDETTGWLAAGLRNGSSDEFGIPPEKVEEIRHHSIAIGENPARRPRSRLMPCISRRAVGQNSHAGVPAKPQQVRRKIRRRIKRIGHLATYVVS
jgi:hypothetical protein